MSVKAESCMEIARRTVELGKKIADARKEGKIPTLFVGIAGEFLVMAKLAQRKLPFEIKGGQAGHDFELNGKKLEVRTSRLKDEGFFSKGKNIRNFGWKLKGKGKDIKFDYVVCVALNETDVKNSKCYVLTKNEVEEAPPVKLPRFKKVEKRLWIFLDLQTMKKAKIDRPKYVSSWEENINLNRDKFLLDNRWKTLFNKTSEH